MLNRLLYSVVFILLSFAGMAQVRDTLPKASFPFENNRNWYKNGWLQEDSGHIFALRDTGFIPKYAGTGIVWQRPSKDTTLWIWSGRKWNQVQGVGGSGIIGGDTTINNQTYNTYQYITYVVDSTVGVARVQGYPDVLDVNPNLNKNVDINLGAYKHGYTGRSTNTVLSTKIGVFPAPNFNTVTVANKLGVSLVRGGTTMKTDTHFPFQSFYGQGFDLFLTINNYPLNAGYDYTNNTAQLAIDVKAFLHNRVKGYTTKISWENEENNAVYRPLTDSSPVKYLNELGTVVQIAHDSGFQITNGGLFGEQLNRWVWKWLHDQPSRVADADTFAKYNFRPAQIPGLATWESNPTYMRGAAFVNTVIPAYASIPIDWVNFHYYCDTLKKNGLYKSLGWISEALFAVTGKIPITNEIGSGITDPTIPSQILARETGLSMPYLIWYSGDADISYALQDSSNTLRPNGENFKSFVSNYAASDTTNKEFLYYQAQQIYHPLLKKPYRQYLFIDSAGREYADTTANGAGPGIRFPPEKDVTLGVRTDTLTVAEIVGNDVTFVVHNGIVLKPSGNAILTNNEYRVNKVTGGLKVGLYGDVGDYFQIIFAPLGTSSGSGGSAGNYRLPYNGIATNYLGGDTILHPLPAMDSTVFYTKYRSDTSRNNIYAAIGSKGNVNGSFTASQVAYAAGSNTLTGSNDFTYNGTNTWIFGNSTQVATATPTVLDMGGTIGNNAAGSTGNLKWRMFPAYGIGMSAGVMEYQVPTGANHVFYYNSSERFRINSAGASVTGTLSSSGNMTAPGYYIGSTLVLGQSSSNVYFQTPGNNFIWNNAAGTGQNMVLSNAGVLTVANNGAFGGTVSGTDIIVSGATAPSVFWGSSMNLSRRGTGIASLGNGTRDDATGTLLLGKIGINTGAPTNLLHVNGTVRIVANDGTAGTDSLLTITGGVITKIPANSYLTSASLAGYEQTSNKATSFSTLNNTLYPTTQAVATYISGFGYGTGTVTNFNKTDGYGIISSVANPSTTPNHTIAIDSATLFSSAVRRKDSTITFATPTQVNGLISANSGNYFVRSGDSASYIWFPNQTLYTANPTSGIKEFDSSGRLTVRTSLGKTYSISTFNLANNQMVIDSLPAYSGTFVMKYNPDTLFYKVVSGTTNTFSNIPLTTAVIGVLPSANGGSGVNNSGTLTWGTGGTLGTAAYTNSNAYEVPLTFSTGLTRSTNTVTSNLSTGIAGGQSVIGGTASGENLTLSSTSNATKGYVGITNAARSTANFGSFSVGDGAFDGTTTGFFAGNSSGTQLAVNAASGFGGRLIDAQVGGSSKFNVDNNGNTNMSGYLGLNANASRLGIGISSSSASASLHIANTTYSTSGVFSTSGFGFREDAATYTSTAPAGSPATVGVNTFAIPTLAASNAQAITNAATMYIAGAPAVGSNVTIANSYALYVASGSTLLGGGFQTTTNATQSNFFTGGNNISNLGSTTSLFFAGASSIYARAVFNGQTSTTIAANNPAANVIVGSSPVTTAATGTHALFANAVFNPLGTVTNTGATVTETATAYFNGNGSGGGINYNIHAAGSTSLNKIDGYTGLGATPTSSGYVTIGAGTTSIAPIQLSAGTLNSSATSGRIETDATNNIWYTNGNSKRFRFGYWNYAAKTTTYTITSGDGTIECTSGTFTVTAPAANTVTNEIYNIVNTGAGTITLSSTSTFNGASSVTINAGHGVQVQAGTTNYVIIGQY